MHRHEEEKLQADEHVCRGGSSPACYRRCLSRHRRRCRPGTRGGPFAALTLGVALVGAAATSGPANPPPPPPASLPNNGRQQDRWVGWTRPPPGPPPDPVAKAGSGNGVVGGGEAAGGGAENAWGTEAQHSLHGADQGALRGDDSCEAAMASEGSDQGMMGQGMMRRGMGAAAAAAQGDSRRMGYDWQDAGGAGPGPGMRETQQQMQERLMMRQGRGPTSSQHEHHPQYRQQEAPPSWGSSAPREGSTPPPPQQQEPYYDGAAGSGNGNNGHWTAPGLPQAPNAMFQQQRNGMGMMGGAGDGAGWGGEAAAGRWEPPSAANAGAITPEVRIERVRRLIRGKLGSGVWLYNPSLSCEERGRWRYDDVSTWSKVQYR